MKNKWIYEINEYEKIIMNNEYMNIINLSIYEYNEYQNNEYDVIVWKNNFLEEI